MTDSNTGENSTKPKRKGQFEKGDPRINRKGRPKDFDHLRKLAQSVACEVAIDPKTKGPLVITTLVMSGGEVVDQEHVVTVGEAILRQWAHDKALQPRFIEVAYGKVPDALDVDLKSDGQPIAVTSITIARPAPAQEQGSEEGASE